MNWTSISPPKSRRVKPPATAAVVTSPGRVATRLGTKVMTAHQAHNPPAACVRVGGFCFSWIYELTNQGDL